MHASRNLPFNYEEDSSPFKFVHVESLKVIAPTLQQEKAEQTKNQWRDILGLLENGVPRASH